MADEMGTPIKMNRRFLRSVRLTEDCRLASGLNGYIVTPSVRMALEKITNAFIKGDCDRAFTLTAPYGTGKSSFGLFLYHLLAGIKDDAWQLLKDVDERLERSCKSVLWNETDTRNGYVVLTATAHRASVSSVLAEALENLGDELPSDMFALVKNLRESRDTKVSLHIFMHCVRKLGSKKRGILLIFDEFGKLLEQARFSAEHTDVFLLQELAEAASRSGDVPFVLLGLLHQSFADYANIGTNLRNEFSKIEGRFEPIAFHESVVAQIQLTAAAFPKESASRAKGDAEQSIIQACEAKLPDLIGLSINDFATYAARACPLHPLTLTALPYFFRRFGQNARSIFSFLTSEEGCGLMEFVRRYGTRRLFRLCDLFDYFFTNFEVQLSRHPFGHVFLEADDVLRTKAATLTPPQIDLVKSIAVLSSLGMQSPINATESQIRFALWPEDAGNSIAALKNQSILVYRKFNKTYALWNGSDIDLEECCKEADAELAKTDFSVAEILAQFLPPAPVVAKRHSVEKGALRFFNMVYVDAPSALVETVTNLKPSAASGTLVVCLPRSESGAETFIAEAKNISSANNALIFAVPGNISELAESLVEVRRLHWIESHVPALRDDRIARREISVRKAEAHQSVSQHQHGILDPRRPPRGGGCVYIWNGTNWDADTNRGISMLLSLICDDLYPQSPTILNELINRRTPSSQAVAARRLVINALIDSKKVAQERLGITGFPPERSIYESVIRASGMHRHADGAWTLCPPDSNSSANLCPAWELVEQRVFESRQTPLAVNELYAELARPPYGMMDGLMPLLVAAFYAVNRDEVSLYYERTFLPDPQESHFELLVRRPELFALSGMRITGTRQSIVERLAQGLETEPKVLSVVRRLYAMMGALSKYARETDAVTESTREFRRIFFEAKSPERLLFVELPAAFGMAAIKENTEDARAFDDYFANLNACIQELGRALPELIERHRAQLLDACGYDNSSTGWQALYDKASFLLARVGGSDLAPFLRTIVNTAGDWSKADRVMAYIQQMPLDKWGALQLQEFSGNLRGVSERFKAACRPYDFVPAALSAQDAAAADSLAASIRNAAPKGPTSHAILRAALLKALQALDSESSIPG